MGDYKYGEGAKDGFSIKVNMCNYLSFGKLGEFGGLLFQEAPNHFTYNVISSVKIQFNILNELVESLTITEPDFKVNAILIN